MLTQDDFKDVVRCLVQNCGLFRSINHATKSEAALASISLMGGEKFPLLIKEIGEGIEQKNIHKAYVSFSRTESGMYGSAVLKKIKDRHEDPQNSQDAKDGGAKRSGLS